MKYHFIQTLKNPLAEMMSDGKTKDFGYWGRMKPSEKNVRKKLFVRYIVQICPQY